MNLCKLRFGVGRDIKAILSKSYLLERKLRSREATWPVALHEERAKRLVQHLSHCTVMCALCAEKRSSWSNATVPDFE